MDTFSAKLCFLSWNSIISETDGFMVIPNANTSVAEIERFENKWKSSKLVWWFAPHQLCSFGKQKCLLLYSLHTKGTTRTAIHRSLSIECSWEVTHTDSYVKRIKNLHSKHRDGTLHKASARHGKKWRVFSAILNELLASSRRHHQHRSCHHLSPMQFVCIRAVKANESNKLHLIVFMQC